MIDIYPPYQKPPMWAPCDPGIVAYNAARMGLPMPVVTMPLWGSIQDASGRFAPSFGSVPPVWQTGINGKVLYFSGVEDSHVSIGNYTPSTKGTVVISLKRYTTGITYRILGFHDAFEFIVMDSNKFANHLFAAGSDVLLSQNTYGVGYHQVIMTWNYSNGELRIFVDGIADGFHDTQANDNPGSGELRLGQRTGAGSYQYKGWIEYCYLFPDEFTQSQVATISADPYGLVQMPRRIWGYVAAAGGISIPVAQYYYNQQRM